MKIVVTHATGTTGRRVLLELLAPEFSVRVIASDPARLSEEIRTQVEVVRGASDDPGTLRRALDGAESLFWSTESPQETDVRCHYERFARAACQAIRETSTAGRRAENGRLRHTNDSCSLGAKRTAP
jgi:uncharacterized protein YbjT (DUF2867 family)